MLWLDQMGSWHERSSTVRKYATSSGRSRSSLVVIERTGLARSVSGSSEDWRAEKSRAAIGADPSLVSSRTIRRARSGHKHEGRAGTRQSPVRAPIWLHLHYLRNRKNSSRDAEHSESSPAE